MSNVFNVNNYGARVVSISILKFGKKLRILFSGDVGRYIWRWNSKKESKWIWSDKGPDRREKEAKCCRELWWGSTARYKKEQEKLWCFRYDIFSYSQDNLSAVIILTQFLDGLMSPTRRMSTSFSSRQRKNEQKRAAESLARKQSSDLDEKSERPSELDLHPSAVSILFYRTYQFLLNIKRRFSVLLYIDSAFTAQLTLIIVK